MKERQQEKYPIIHNGKQYYERNCDALFLAFYHGPEALVNQSAVRVDSETIVYPDGEMEDF